MVVEVSDDAYFYYVVVVVVFVVVFFYYVQLYPYNNLYDYIPHAHANDDTAFCVFDVDALHTMYKHNDNNPVTVDNTIF